MLKAPKGRGGSAGAGRPYDRRIPAQQRLTIARTWALALCLGLSLGGVAHAVEPSEMLKDPVLEARARKISAGLRCLVCQNESIDDSGAALAHDIRVVVRQRLEAGDTNDEVRDYLVARYGQFVLLRPPVETQTLLLWGTPILVLGLGGLAIAGAARRRPRQDPARPLSEAEQRRLDDLLHRPDEPPGTALRQGAPPSF